MMLVLKRVLWHHTLFHFLKTSFNIQAYVGQKLQRLIRKYEILSTQCGVSSTSPSFFPILTLFGGRGFFLHNILQDLPGSS